MLVRVECFIYFDERMVNCYGVSLWKFEKKKIFWKNFNFIGNFGLFFYCFMFVVWCLFIDVDDDYDFIGWNVVEGGWLIWFGCGIVCCRL